MHGHGQRRNCSIALNGESGLPKELVPLSGSAVLLVFFCGLPSFAVSQHAMKNKNCCFVDRFMRPPCDFHKQ
jgi:hypothetical protein